MQRGERGVAIVEFVREPCQLGGWLFVAPSATPPKYPLEGDDRDSLWTGVGVGYGSLPRIGYVHFPI